MPALTPEEYEALTGALERQNNRSDELTRRLLAWEETSPAALWLKTLCERYEIPAYYFGGVCRDVWNGKSPRDIDIVVQEFAWRHLLDATKHLHPQRNRFGGLKMVVEGTEVDAWSIENTWAFTHGKSAPFCVTKLPETTLLNIESVVAMVWHPEGKIVFEKGFFRAMENRTLEIQIVSLFHDIPYPALALARIERFLSQGWKEGKTIKAFREKYPIPPEEVEAARQKHYDR